MTENEWVSRQRQTFNPEDFEVGERVRFGDSIARVLRVLPGDGLHIVHFGKPETDYTYVPSTCRTPVTKATEDDEDEVDIFLDTLFSIPPRRRSKLPEEKKEGGISAAIGVVFGACLCALTVAGTVLLIHLMMGAM